MKVFSNILITVISYVFSAFLMIFGLLPLLLLGQNNAGGVAMIIYGILLLLLTIFEDKYNNIKWVKRFKIAVLSLMLCCFIVAAVISCFMIKYGFFSHPEPDENGTLVILGCRAYEDRPSVMLKNRLDGAIEYLHNNDTCKIIVCGGQGEDEQYSESYVMAKYLVENGIPQERIIQESKSSNTEENIKYAVDIIRENGLDEKMIIVSDSFHLYRASLFASEYDMSVKCVRGEEYALLFPSYWVREVLGVLHMTVLE